MSATTYSLAPKISVLMSVYNGSRYLKESVDSILNQSFTDFELIIIDDCSTDNTWEILTKYAAQDQRIRLFKNQKNCGLTKSLNCGLKLAKGECIARQDADDISLHKRFEKQIACLNEHPEVILVSCDLELIDSKGNLIGKFQRACNPDLVGWYLLFYNHLAGHSQVMFRRETVINLGGYCENRRYSQDYELWCRLVKVGKIVILPEVLVKQRRHNESISTKKTQEQKAYSLKQVINNIKQLINEEISMEQAEEIRGFWLGSWWSNFFPDGFKARVLYSRINKMSQAFIEQNSEANSSISEISLQLETLIENQFILWLQASLNRKESWLSRLVISHYAFRWQPLKVIASWLDWLKNLSSKIQRELIRLHQKKTSKTIY